MLLSPPTDPVAQLQWLVDRAIISELIYSFAAAIDARDQPGYAATFADDGVVILPHGRFCGIEAIRAMQGPPAHWGTHHLSANHEIRIDGDAATVRAYVIATHVFAKEVLTDNASAGGWYDMQVARHDGGWRFTNVELKVVWTNGEMIRKPGDLG